MIRHASCLFFLNDPPPTEIYTLSLHDALPICRAAPLMNTAPFSAIMIVGALVLVEVTAGRSEEHTSELQSRPHLVCRLLLEKKNKNARQLPIPFFELIENTRDPNHHTNDTQIT